MLSMMVFIAHIWKYVFPASSEYRHSVFTGIQLVVGEGRDFTCL